METMQSVWPRAVARAWQDDLFRQELLADASGALKRHFALEVPAGASLKVIENGKTTSDTLVLPPRPSDLDDGLIDVDRGSNDAPQCCCCC